MASSLLQARLPLPVWPPTDAPDDDVDMTNALSVNRSLNTFCALLNRDDRVMMLGLWSGGPELCRSHGRTDTKRVTGVPGLRNGTPAASSGAAQRTMRGAGSEAAWHHKCPVTWSALPTASGSSDNPTQRPGLPRLR